MLANVGDMDGDGVTDLAVGASDAYAGLSNVYVLFMCTNGTVRSYSTISQGVGGGPMFAPFSLFGSSALNLGDLDGDGVNDLAIGSAYFTDVDNKARTGAVYVCFMSRAGTIRSFAQISEYSSDNTFPFIVSPRRSLMSLLLSFIHC
jgi:hypothetical protein